jgi:hypothetical protein
MHGHINVKSPNNTRKWQMGFNSAFKGLTELLLEEILKENYTFMGIAIYVYLLQTEFDFQFV